MIELIGAIGGLVVPPVFDFIKKKFLGSDQDSPERTLSTLAVSKPEQIAPFVDAQSKLLEAKSKFFNRDVIGTPSLWVVNLRASIRPIFVVLSLAARVAGWVFDWDLDDSFTILMDVCISSWFGSRLK
jgi:hypothetical protein